MKMQQMQADMELKARDHEQQMAMAAQSHAQELQNMQQKAQVTAASELAMSRVYQAAEVAKVHQNIVNSQATHEQKLSHAKEQQKLASSQNKSSKSGNSTK
jgi:hypothetical protein